ncbi:MAG: dephospho-CoA kinase [Nitrospinae bacterium]|nr:dephospho-CoA kinase [Nitrospinota bacterium]
MIGVTGGYASGKSLVAGALQAHGACLIDCDALAREVVAPGTPGLASTVEKFGKDILLTDGSLDRKKLGAIVFTDEGKRKLLESILHPIIRARVFELAAAELDKNPGSAIVVEAAVMFESGLSDAIGVKIVVTCPRETQIQRGMRRDWISRDDAVKRIAAQWPLEKKASLADYVIDNGGPAEATLAQVEEVWNKISS